MYSPCLRKGLGPDASLGQSGEKALPDVQAQRDGWGSLGSVEGTASWLGWGAPVLEHGKWIQSGKEQLTRGLWSLTGRVLCSPRVSRRIGGAPAEGAHGTGWGWATSGNV